MVEVIEAPYFTYAFTCIDADGNVKWAETFRNVVTTQGKNDLLDKYFGAGTNPANWFMGLKGSAEAPAATMTYGTKGFTESTAYGNAARPTLAFSAAASGSKATSAAAAFNINATATINGAFTATNSTKGDSVGAGAIMYSVGDFAAARSVANGDTLSVSLTLSL